MKKLIVFVALLMSLSFACFAEETPDPCSTLVIELAKQHLVEEFGIEEVIFYNNATAYYQEEFEEWGVLFIPTVEENGQLKVLVDSILSYRVRLDGSVYRRPGPFRVH